MLRFRWFFLTCLGIILSCSPVEAGQLLFWRFEANQNRLVFTTDAGVQPRAQLIPNPTRLVIDLPGTTLGRPTVKQSIGNIIRSVRAGQFDAQTTRLVVELAPGYTIDPNQVKFRGVSSNQWIVTLPQPQRIVTSRPTTNPSPRPQPLPPSRRSNNTSDAPRTASSSDFRVTRNGLLINITGGNNRDIRIKRSRDRRTIDIDLKGVTLPEHLKSQTFSVNNYQISDVKLTQISTSLARVTLMVDPDSPDWQATFSRDVGLVLFPRGGLQRLESSGVSPGPVAPNQTSPPPSTTTTAKSIIESVALTGNNQQLLIRSNRAVRSQGQWNRSTRTYQITLLNAILSDAFRGPQLNQNSPISRLRVRQQDTNTVVLLVELAPGVQPGQLNPTHSQQIVLGLSPASQVIPVPRPERGSIASPPSQPSNRQGKVLVIIDPGHGGKDPGTIGIGGVREKDIVLPLSKQVATYLQNQGVLVKMTRTSDYFVSLAGRTQLANRERANLFVSIHANAINLSRPDINGLETYYYQSGRSLAATIHRNILRNVTIRDRRVRRARFYVLRHSKMPSVLVEVGFLTGREDAPRLKTPSHRQKMADAIAQGILQYIQGNRI